MKDRLSILPEEVLQLILSFLYPRFAVQTSVLSKKWRYLWTGIPTIRLEYNLFKGSSDEKFLSNMLFHRDEFNFIRHLEICSNIIFSDKYIMKLIYNLLYLHGRGIQHILLSASGECFDDLLPQPLWNLFITWDSLKTLILEDIRIKIMVNYDFVSLETFNMMRCFLSTNDDFDYDDYSRFPLKGIMKISAPQLIELKISWLEFPWEHEDFKIILHTPKLSSFYYECETIFHLSIIPKRPILRKVYVDYYNGNKSYRSGNHLIIHLMNMLGEVGNAKSVTLTFDTIEALSVASDDAMEKQDSFNGIEELKIMLEEHNITNYIY